MYDISVFVDALICQIVPFFNRDHNCLFEIEIKSLRLCNKLTLVAF